MFIKNIYNYRYAIVLNLAWVTLHYIAPHLYVYFCVPDTIVGFLLSPLYASTPHCYALRWIIYYCGNNIVTMWIIAGTIFIKVLKKHSL